jgi:hypothetical protein
MNNKREAEILRKLMGPRFESAVGAHKGFIAGGAVRSVFSSDHVADLDIFFHTREDFDACIAALGDGEEYSPTFTFTDSAATHISTGNEAGDIPRMRYQLISAEFGLPGTIIQKFDFTMCMGAWRPETGEFILDDLFLKHVAQKRLCYNANGVYPICSLWRAAKFIKRGWRLPGIEAIKLALAINNIGIKDYGELKKQLMGIDTIFLAELTESLAHKAEARYDFGEAVEFIAGFMDEEEA